MLAGRTARGKGAFVNRPQVPLVVAEREVDAADLNSRILEGRAGRQKVIIPLQVEDVNRQFVDE
jgi:hypothetical protein